jgi:hypothetical protein
MSGVLRLFLLHRRPEFFITSVAYMESQSEC